MRRTPILWLAVCLTACGGFTHGQRARTLGQGVRQSGGSLGYQFVGGGSHGVRAEGLFRWGLLPNVDFQLRGGVNVSLCERDCTLHRGMFGSVDLEAGAKVALTPREWRFAVSVAPSVGAVVPAGIGARVPVLFGYLHGNGNESVLTISGALLNAFHPSISYAHVFKDGDALIIPELAVGVYGPRYDQLFAQAGVAILWGDGALPGR